MSKFIFSVTGEEPKESGNSNKMSYSERDRTAKDVYQAIQKWLGTQKRSALQMEVGFKKITIVIVEVD